MIDFHSHILPGMDDGSAGPEESVAMLRMEAAQGLEHVVLTPHFYPYEESPDSFLARRDAAERTLRAALKGLERLPRLLAGAEVFFFRGMSESEELAKLAIRGTRAIMIELPPAPWPEAVYQELAMIRERWDLIPIIAHIDRYIGPLRTYGIPERLARLPVLVQANGSCFLNWRTAGMAVRMLQRGQIHLLGSDCHNMTSRKPNLEQAGAYITEKLGPGALARVREHEYQILGI